MTMIEKNYRTLEKMEFLSKLRQKSYVRYKRNGMKDLHLNRMRDDGKLLHFSIAHYALDGGVLKADPDMEIVADWSKGIVTPLTYQDDTHELYKELSEEPMSDQQLHTELNQILDQWLHKIGESGYTVANER